MNDLKKITLPPPPPPSQRKGMSIGQLFKFRYQKKYIICPLPVTLATSRRNKCPHILESSLREKKHHFA